MRGLEFQTQTFIHSGYRTVSLSIYADVEVNYDNCGSVKATAKFPQNVTSDTFSGLLGNLIPSSGVLHGNMPSITPHQHLSSFLTWNVDAPPLDMAAIIGEYIPLQHSAVLFLQLKHCWGEVRYQVWPLVAVTRTTRCHQVIPEYQSDVTTVTQYVYHSNTTPITQVVISQ